MLEYVATSEPWRGERIDGIAHPRNIETAWSAEELAAIGLRIRPAPEPDLTIYSYHVDAERDRRIADGFEFGGHRFQTHSDALANFAGAATLALGAIMSGAQPGDYRWADPDTDFTWLTEANAQMLLDAQTMFALASAAAAHKKRMIFAARALKDMSPIPGDYATNETYWSA